MSAAASAVPAAAMTSGTVWLWIALILVLVLVLLLVGYLIWRSKHPAKADPDANAAVDEATGGGTDLAEMVGSFRAALSAIRARVEGRDFRYRVPWFLLMGQEGAGKTSLLSESSMASTLEEQVGLQHAVGLTWNFFGDGVVIDVGGWCLKEGAAETTLWRRLLRLFVNHRAERPLDGIVLTIPAGDLFGAKALSPAELVQRGTLIAQRLRQLTQIIGFHLPIYLVLTQCDALTGFAEFSNELSAVELEQIFGWSNPFDDRLQFQLEWVDQAISTMRVTVERVQSRLFAEHEPSAAREAMFLFPGSLHALLQPLRLLLSRAMRGGADAPAPLLRGIYCCGSTDGGRKHALREPALIPVALPDARGSHFTDLHYTSEAQGWLSSAALTPWLQTRLHIAFAHDLFFHKIFPERNLGVPLARFFSLRDRVRLSLQTASVVLALILLLGTGFAFHRLSRDTTHLTGLLGTVDQELQTPPRYGDSGTADMHAGASDLIASMARFQSGQFRSIFLPVSWFSALPGEIRTAMVGAFKVLVLERFHDGLEARAHRIADPRRMPLGRTELPVPTPNDPPVTQLDNLPAYMQMRAFLTQVYNLDRNIAVYNRLSRFHSQEPLQSVVSLDEYLHNHPEPAASQGASNPYFQQAIDEASYQAFDYPPELQYEMTAKAKALIEQLDEAWIEHGPLRVATDKLVVDLDILSNPQPETLTGLTSISNDLRQAQTLYAAPELGWTGAMQPVVPVELSAITSDISSSSPFFKTTLSDWIHAVDGNQLSQLEASLTQAQSPITGPVLDNASGHWALSAGSTEVQTALNSLLKTGFVSEGTGTLESEVVARANHIEWDKSALDAAAAMPASYGKYVTEQLSAVRPSVRTAMTRVASAALSTSIEGTFLAAAHPSSGGSVASDAQAFSDAAPSLTALLGSLEQYGLMAPARELRGIALRQAAAVLSELNEELDTREPYGVPNGAFANWTEGPPSAEIFNAATPDALAAFTTAQYDEIARLNTAAQPAVRFLESNKAGISARTARILARWDGIGTALNAYTGKKPGNSVQALDDLIATGEDKIVPANGCASTHLATQSRPDYFSLAATQLQHSLVLRCDELLTQSFESSYARLAEAFNAQLSGRFPFAAPDAAALNEADPAAVAEVYHLRDTSADLFRSPRAMAAPDSVRVFLAGLEEARPWFTSLLSTASNNSLALDVQPEFRVDRSRELGGNQIIDWTLQVGATSVHMGDAPTKLHWNSGDPIVLTLRWARNAFFLPAKALPAESTNGALRSDGETVSWRFADSWSLLRMIRTFTQADEVNSFRVGDPFTLELKVPEVPASTTAANMQSQAMSAAQVYLRLLVTPPGGKDAIDAKRFPVVAPPLRAHFDKAAKEMP